MSMLLDQAAQILDRLGVGGLSAKDRMLEYLIPMYSHQELETMHKLLMKNSN